MKMGSAAHPGGGKVVRTRRRYARSDVTAESGAWFEGDLERGGAPPPAAFATMVASQLLATASCREIHGRQTESSADRAAVDGTGESSGRQPAAAIVFQLLHPELGTVDVRVSTVHSGVAISFVTQTATGRAAIAGQVEQLIRPIRQQGIAISRCDVRTAESHPVAADQSTPQRRDYWA